MPRDSLGRIVYVGDVYSTCSDGERRDLVVTMIANEAIVGALTSDGVLAGFPADSSAVDLAASAYRTNYERYFADLGTREGVIEAAMLACRGVRPCRTCPLWGWSAAFGVRVGICILGFDAWLDERAAI